MMRFGGGGARSGTAHRSEIAAAGTAAAGTETMATDARMMIATATGSSPPAGFPPFLSCSSPPTVPTEASMQNTGQATHEEREKLKRQVLEVSAQTRQSYDALMHGLHRQKEARSGGIAGPGSTCIAGHAGTYSAAAASAGAAAGTAAQIDDHHKRDPELAEPAVLPALVATAARGGGNEMGIAELYVKVLWVDPTTGLERQVLTRAPGAFQGPSVWIGLDDGKTIEVPTDQLRPSAGETRERARKRKKQREGDWDCAFCGALVFAGKPQCFKCGTPMPGGEPGSLGVGVVSAGNLASLAAHASLMLAGHPGAAAGSAAQMDTHHKGDPETRSKRGGRKERAREREEGDWDCASCGALVFAGRLQCFKCRAPMWDARAARQNQVMPGGEPALEEGGGEAERARGGEASLGVGAVAGNGPSAATASKKKASKMSVSHAEALPVAVCGEEQRLRREEEEDDARRREDQECCVCLNAKVSVRRMCSLYIECVLSIFGCAGGSKMLCVHHRQVEGGQTTGIT